MARRHRVWEATHEAILRTFIQSSKTVSELKVALDKIWDNPNRRGH